MYIEMYIATRKEANLDGKIRLTIMRSVAFDGERSRKVAAKSRKRVSAERTQSPYTFSSPVPAIF